MKPYSLSAAAFPASAWVGSVMAFGEAVSHPEKEDGSKGASGLGAGLAAVAAGFAAGCVAVLGFAGACAARDAAASERAAMAGTMWLRMFLFFSLYLRGEVMLIRCMQPKRRNLLIQR